MAKKQAPKLKTEAAAPIATVPLSFESPESSSIASATYYLDTHKLSVSFYTPTKEIKTYELEAVPLSIWEPFCRAESKGSHYNQYIRPFFPARRV